MSNPNTFQEVADHVRRIQSAYYYEAYQSIARSEEDGEEGEDQPRHALVPGFDGISSSDSSVLQMSPTRSLEGREKLVHQSTGSSLGQSHRSGAFFPTGEEGRGSHRSDPRTGLVPTKGGGVTAEEDHDRLPDVERREGREGEPIRWEGTTSLSLSSSSPRTFSPTDAESGEGGGEAGRGRKGRDTRRSGSSHKMFSSSHESFFLAGEGRSARLRSPNTTEKGPWSGGSGVSEMWMMSTSPHAVAPSSGLRDPVIVCGNGNRPLAEAVALVLGVKTHDTSVVQYESGEVHVEFHAPVMGRDVYIIQSTGGNKVVDTNTAIMELLLLIRNLRLQFAKSITAIVPFLGYSTQDCKNHLRSGFGAAVVAKMITLMGVDRVATLDLHSHQSQGYFENTPLDILVMVYEFVKYFKAQPWFAPERVAVVAPDARAVSRARQLADLLSVTQIVTILRRRAVAPHSPTGSAEPESYPPQTVLETAGSVEGLHCIVVDDLMDTGTTIIQACDLLLKMGARGISACCTHGLLSPPAEARIMRCEGLTEVIVSDSIPQEEHQQRIPKLKVVSIAPLLASVVRTYEKGHSLASLFPH